MGAHVEGGVNAIPGVIDVGLYRNFISTVMVEFVEYMGHVWVDVELISGGDREVRVKALVDSGATLTVIPRALAVELGLRVTDRGGVVMTAGGPVNVEFSEVKVRLMGREATVRVVISDIIDKVLIGITTLEILGLMIDPTTGTLKEAPYLLY